MFLLDLYLMMAVATVVVVLCTSKAGSLIRDWQNPLGVFDCPFCTSVWVTLFTAPIVNTEYLWLRIPALVAGANVFILLIHLSMGTTDYVEEVHETPEENEAG